jgi:hypothetical protein
VGATLEVGEGIFLSDQARELGERILATASAGRLRAAGLRNLVAPLGAQL